MAGPRSSASRPPRPTTRPTARTKGTCPVCGQQVAILKAGTLAKHTRVQRSTGTKVVCRGRHPAKGTTTAAAVGPVSPAVARYRGLPTDTAPDRQQSVRSTRRQILGLLVLAVLVATCMAAVWIARWSGLSTG